MIRMDDIPMKKDNSNVVESNRENFGCSCAFAGDQTSCLRTLLAADAVPRDAVPRDAVSRSLLLTQ